MTKYSRVRLICVMGSVFLGSCINVSNTIPNQYEQQRAEQIEDKADRIAQRDAESNPIAAIESRGNVCPLYKMPPLPKRPKKPTEQIAALHDGDEEKLDQIAQDYVKSLERYNTTVTRILQQSYADYLDRCVKNLPKPVQAR